MTFFQHNAKNEPVSSVLRRMLSSVGSSERVTLGQILHSFGVSGFAFLLMALALINMVVFVLPGLSLIFGVPMVFLAVQMVIGLRAPVFPAFIRRGSIGGEAFVKGMLVGVKVTERLEKFVKPRFSFLAGENAARIHGMLALLLSIMVAMPIPFMNLVPSLGVVILGLGLLQRDGLFISIAYGIGLLSMWLYSSLSHLAGAIAH